ncbi:MAG: hypothetical protein HY695_17610 [Deltaproteobacteria bacterium]|nr:hypothetical protein [Deltaproteobacteria bacterium]
MSLDLLEWEQIQEDWPYIWRAPVPGGWLIREFYLSREQMLAPPGVLPTAGGVGLGVGCSLAFVPDPSHSWNAKIKFPVGSPSSAV